MLSGYSCALIVVFILLAWSIVLISWCLRFRHQRDVLCRAFGKYHLYTPIPDGEELFVVMDQIEGARKKERD